MWCRDERGCARLLGPGTGPGQVRLNRQLDLLTYVAVRAGATGTAEANGLRWVSETEARTELWNEAASKQIVGITAHRLMADLKRVGVQMDRPLVRVEHGRVALDDDRCMVDVAIFHQAVAAARAARGADGVAAAETALAAYGGPLLEDVVADVADDDVRLSARPARGGRPESGPLLGWTQEIPARSLASRLEALYREASSLLAVRLRDAQRWEDALHWAWEALQVGEIVPSDHAERLARLVVEVAGELHDGARLRGEYQALEGRLEQCGLEMPAQLEQRYTHLQGAAWGG